MSFFFDKLQEIENLQSKIEQHGKIAADVLRKINYKFRLDWNYYSNVIEGNSLTMQETRSIMIGNITVDGKPIKDVMEMKGHDDVISDIMKIGKSELNLSEKRIKDIHKGIMHEENLDKAPLIGKWKTEPNYLYNFKKERFDFTAPADVPDEMHKLINWLNTEKEKIARKAKDALHPIQLAFHFHIDYVTIHPFYDGNGRTARIFTNLILIGYGYPPVYVKDTEKEVYNQYLGEIQTYGGDTELFYDFMAGLLIRSQQLVVDAIEGKEIDEANDWQKKLQLLKLERDSETIAKKTNEIIYNIYDNSIVPLIKRLFERISTVKDLFNFCNFKISSASGHVNLFSDTPYIKDLIFREFRHYQNDICFTLTFSGLKPDNEDSSSIHIDIYWRFEELKYILSISDKEIAKSYPHSYNQQEIDTYIDIIGNNLTKQIEVLLK